MERTILLHVLPSFNVGGREMRFAQIANRFTEKYHHLIVSLDGQTACKALLNEDVSYEILTPPDLSGSIVSRLWAIRRFLNQQQYHKLVTYNWGSIEWALAHWGRSQKHIHIEDGFGPEEKNRQIPRRVWFRRIALKATEHVIVPSKTLLQIAKDQWKISERRLNFIANGVDLNAFANPDFEQYRSLFFHSDRLKIGTIARLRKEKNIPRLLTAFESLCEEHNIELWIAGDGPELETIESYVNSSPHKKIIHMVGNIDSPANYMCHLDIFALSSDTEQMPYSVLEACAAGKPVASVDVGDIKSLVSEDNQQFVSGTTAEDLVNSLEQLLKNKTLRLELGEKNQQFCQSHFAVEIMLSAYDQLFTAH